VLELLASTRLQILLKLRERPYTISELSKALGFSKTTASYHLERLESSGLVQRVERGKWVYYKITERGLNSVRVKIVALVFSLSASIVSAVAIIAQVSQKFGETQTPAYTKEIKPLSAPPAPDYFLLQSLALLLVCVVTFLLFLYFRR
jgi:DNA-binding transcriptional ArsR family regulator